MKACCLKYCIIFISKLQLIDTLHSYLTFTQKRKFYFDCLNSPETGSKTGSNPIYLRSVSFLLLAVKQRVLTGQDGCQFFSLLQCCAASCGLFSSNPESPSGDTLWSYEAVSIYVCLAITPFFDRMWWESVYWQTWNLSLGATVQQLVHLFLFY